MNPLKPEFFSAGFSFASNVIAFTTELIVVMGCYRGTKSVTSGGGQGGGKPGDEGAQSRSPMKTGGGRIE